MIEGILEKYLEWFVSQSIYTDFLAYMPEPLCNPVFASTAFVIFGFMLVSIVTGSVSSWNFNRKMKKKARELEQMRAEERLEDARRERERKLEREAERGNNKEMKEMMAQYLKFMALVNAQNTMGQMMSLKNMTFDQWQSQMYKTQPDVIIVPPTEEEIEVKKPKNKIVYIDDNILENEIHNTDDSELIAKKAEEEIANPSEQSEEEARLEAEKIEFARKEAERKQAEELARIEAEKERQRLEAERKEAEKFAELERIAREQAEAKARAEEEARIKAEEESRLKAEEASKRKAFEEEQARIKAENEQRAREEAMAEAERIAKEEADRKAEEARLEAERLAEVQRIEAEYEAERQRRYDEALRKEKEEEENTKAISDIISQLSSSKDEEEDIEVVSTSYVPEIVPDKIANPSEQSEEEVETSSVELTDEQESDFAKLVAMMANDEKQKGQISSYKQKKSEAKKKNIEALDIQIASGIEDKKDAKADKTVSNDDALEQQKKEALARLEAEKNQPKKEKFSLFKKK